MISAAPIQPHTPSRSPASQKPKNAAKTGSSAKASAVRVALSPLRPGLDEEAERAREDASDEERAPHRPAARHLDLPERDRDDEEADEGRRHLREGQRDGVEPRRVPLHQDDLHRIDRRGAEHERVTASRPASTPERSDSPTVESPTPSHTAAAIRVRKTTSASSGVKTT